MANINKDYLVIADLKSSKVTAPAMVGYNTDKRIFNIFAKLKISMSSNPDITVFVGREDANNYSVKLTVIKPTTKQLRYATGELMSSGTIGNGAVYQFDLGEEFTDQVGKYICELTVTCTVNGFEEIVTCDPFTYIIKPSAVTGLNPELERTIELPILEQLINEVKEVKKDIEEGTLGDYQTKIDDNLQTDSKEIIGAINELKATSGDLSSDKIATDLTTDDDTKVLSAKQGKVLQDTKVEVVRDGLEQVGLPLNTYPDLKTSNKTLIGGINEVVNKVTVIEETKVDIIEDELNQRAISDNVHSNLNTTNKTVIGSINEVNAQLQTVVTQKADKNDLNTQKTRIDNLASNTGTTINDLELQDIRVGADGIPYPNAGEAIRTQYVKLNIGMNNLKNNLESISVKRENRPTHTTEDGYIDNQGRKLASNGYVMMQYDVQQLTDYKVVAYAKWGNVPVSFWNNDIFLGFAGTVNSGGVANLEKQELNIITPLNCNKIRVQSTTWGVASTHYLIEYLITMKTTKILNGVKWVALGDSLTAVSTLSGGKNYTDFVGDELGLTLVNMGEGGTGYWKEKNNNKAFYQRALNIPNDTKIVTVFGSFNDSYDVTNYELGNVSDTTDATLFGCMNKMLTNIYSVNPDIIVGIITPTPWSGRNLRLEARKEKTLEYVNALKTFAQYNSLPLLDLFSESNLRPWESSFNTKYFLNADGVHVLSEGHRKFITPKISDFILKIYK